jgi:uncharacterized protein
LALFSVSELLLGVVIVIGHNVFHVLPNEVPILFVLGLVSVRVRDGGWSAIGFRRPKSWLGLVLIALAAAVLRIVLGDFVIEPLAGHWWPPIHPPAGTEHIAGNIKMALLWLLIIWTFAAFGEEISYRGYLTLRAADVGGEIYRRLLAGNTPGVSALWLRALLQRSDRDSRFERGRFHSGIGVFASGRNLWAPVLAHGLIDTVGVIVAFFGWEG